MDNNCEKGTLAYGPALDDPASIYAASSPMPEITVSRRVRGPAGMEHWLRFASPSPRMADQVYARVYEPEDIADAPTLIFGHGICVEFDHWNGTIDEVAALCGMGIRVVRPEGPWHGRRVLAGTYAHVHRPARIRRRSRQSLLRRSAN